MREWYRSRWLFSFAVLLAVMLVGLVLWLLITGEGRLWPRDFEVFYKAGERAAAGENLYRPFEDGFYHYKYSPAAALLFIPLSLLPLDIAGVVYRVALIFVILLGLYLAMRLSDTGFPGGKRLTAAGDARVANRTVLLSGLVLSLLFYSELTLGQVNQPVIVAGLAAALLIASNRRPWLTAALLASSVFIKPYLLIFLPYLLLRRRWRELGGFFVFSGVLLLLPALFYGGGFVHQYRRWLDALLQQVDGGQGLLESGNHTIYGYVARVTPLRWLLDGHWVTPAYKVVLLLLLTLAVLWLLRRGSGFGNREALDFAVLMLLVPLLVLTSENGFGFVELAVVLLVFDAHKRDAGERKVLGLALALLWLGTLVNQVSGPAIDSVLTRVHSWSLITAGTLVLLVLLYLNRYRLRL